MSKRSMKSWLIAALLAGVFPISTSIAANGTAGEKIVQTETQQEAMAALLEMAAFMAGLEAFTVKVRAGYDSLQQDGQMIEFLEARNIAVSRPDRLRIDDTGGIDVGSYTLFDGSKMAVWDAQDNVYAQADQPGTIDDTVVYFVRELGMRLPLAPLLMTRLPAELQQRVRTVDYVETTEVLGQWTHQLAGRTDDVDFQVWIADGVSPLPVRIVLTYPDEGRPQYWAEFSDWNLQPVFDTDTFEFLPPESAQQIAFAVQFRELEGQMGTQEQAVNGGTK